MDSYLFKHELDNQGHMTTLFCMHSICVEMLRHNPWVLSMDCTYKTNRHAVPLLDTVRLASTNQTCFIDLHLYKMKTRARDDR